MRFLVGALPEVQNCFQKQFLDKAPYNYTSLYKKKMERVVSKNGTSKKLSFHSIFEI